MKLTEKDIQLLKALNKSETGKDLLDYLVRLTDYICDSRTWGKDDTKESVNKAAQIIKAQIIDKINLTNKDKTVNQNDFV